MIKENLHKFSGKADIYSIGRPSYAQKAIDLIFELNPNAITFADIGSGTGILTEQLLTKGRTVYAVEPNNDMRCVAEKRLKRYANFVSIAATAENTTLEKSSIDVITVAQAFHWFDIKTFKKECERILRNKMNVFLIWNRKDIESEIMSDIREIYSLYCPTFKGHAGGKINEIVCMIEEFFDNKMQTTMFENDIVYDLNGFLNMHLSQSYSPLPNSENYSKYVQKMTEIFNKYQNNGTLKMSNNTHLYWNSD